MLRACGLKVTGNKAELIERLGEEVEDEVQGSAKRQQVGEVASTEAAPMIGAVLPTGAAPLMEAVLPTGAAPLDPRDAEWAWEAKEIEVIDIPFTLTPGPCNCPPALTVLESFSTIFPYHLLQHIISNTNNYASQCTQHKQLGSVTMEEMCTYFAILLAMCMKTAPAMKDHWSEDPLLGTPWIKEKMGQERWFTILRALILSLILLFDHTSREWKVGIVK